MSSMHPLVRDLYKRVLVVGKDYPQGLSHVKKQWKTALRNPENCPSAYSYSASAGTIEPLTVAQMQQDRQCEKEIRKAVGKGRFMVREMVGVIQLKKYRTLKERYSLENQEQLQEAIKNLEGKKLNWN